MGIEIQLLALVCVLVPLIAADADHLPCQLRWQSDIFYNQITDKLEPIRVKKKKSADLLYTDGSFMRKVVSSKPTGLFDTQREQHVQQSDIFCARPGDKTHIADMNGDHFNDLLCRKADGTFSVRYRYGNNFKAELPYAEDFQCGSTLDIIIGDFDGNHADDILCYDSAFSVMESSPIYFSGGCEGKRRVSPHYHYGSRPKASYGRYQTFKMHHGRHSKGCDPALPKKAALAVGALGNCNIQRGDKIMAVDANGDGEDDIVCFTHATAGAGVAPDSVYPYLSKGTTDGLVFATQTTAISGCDSTLGIVLPADIDGDGDDDLLCLHNDVASTDHIKVAFYKMGAYESAFLDTDVSTCSGVNVFCHETGVTAVPMYHAGDFNSDGTDDIMCRFEDGGIIKTRMVYSEYYKP